MAVKPGLVDDGADPGQRRIAMPGDGVSEQGHRARIGPRQPEQHPDERGLAGPVGAEIAEGAAPGDEQFDPVHGDVGAEALGEPMGLHGPVALGRLLVGAPRERGGGHPMLTRAPVSVVTASTAVGHLESSLNGLSASLWSPSLAPAVPRYGVFLPADRRVAGLFSWGYPPFRSGPPRSPRSSCTSRRVTAR